MLSTNMVETFTCAYCGNTMQEKEIDDHLQFYHIIKMTDGMVRDWSFPHAKKHIFYLRVKVRNLNW